MKLHEGAAAVVVAVAWAVAPEGGGAGPAIEITFDRPMDRASVEGALRLGGMALPAGRLIWSRSDTVLAYLPGSPLARRLAAQLGLVAGAKAADGAPLVAGLASTFRRPRRMTAELCESRPRRAPAPLPPRVHSGVDQPDARD